MQRAQAKAIQAELDATAVEYTLARNDFEVAQVRFEVAREKLASLKRFAASVLSPYEFMAWQTAHANVSYVGSSLGEAIVSVLEQHAWDQACKYAAGVQQVYFPAVLKESIVATLEAGGFDFRTSSHLREVHGALINLEGAKQREDGTYIAANADAILQTAKAVE